jgi:hypothetical protein
MAVGSEGLWRILGLTPSFQNVGCQNRASAAIEYAFSGGETVWDSLEVSNPFGWVAVTWPSGTSYYGPTGILSSFTHLHEEVHREQARAGRELDEAEADGEAVRCMSLPEWSLREQPEGTRPRRVLLNGRAK